MGLPTYYIYLIAQDFITIIFSGEMDTVKHLHGRKFTTPYVGKEIDRRSCAQDEAYASYCHYHVAIGCKVCRKQVVF